MAKLTATLDTGSREVEDIVTAFCAVYDYEARVPTEEREAVTPGVFTFKIFAGFIDEVCDAYDARVAQQQVAAQIAAAKGEKIASKIELAEAEEVVG